MNSQIFDQLLLKSQEQETKNVHYIVFDVIVGPFWWSEFLWDDEHKFSKPNTWIVLAFILNLYALIFKIKLFQKFGVHNTSDTISVIF